MKWTFTKTLICLQSFKTIWIVEMFQLFTNTFKILCIKPLSIVNFWIINKSTWITFRRPTKKHQNEFPQPKHPGGLSEKPISRTKNAALNLHEPSTDWRPASTNRDRQPIAPHPRQSPNARARANRTNARVCIATYAPGERAMLYFYCRCATALKEAGRLGNVSWKKAARNNGRARLGGGDAVYKIARCESKTIDCQTVLPQCVFILLQKNFQQIPYVYAKKALSIFFRIKFY